MQYTVTRATSFDEFARSDGLSSPRLEAVLIAHGFAAEISAAPNTWADSGPIPSDDGTLLLDCELLGSGVVALLFEILPEDSQARATAIAQIFGIADDLAARVFVDDGEERHRRELP